VCVCVRERDVYLDAFVNHALMSGDTVRCVRERQ